MKKINFNIFNLKISKRHLHNIQNIFKYFINAIRHHFIYYDTKSIVIVHLNKTKIQSWT